jgi:hypothetical protein
MRPRLKTPEVELAVLDQRARQRTEAILASLRKIYPRRTFVVEGPIEAETVKTVDGVAQWKVERIYPRVIHFVPLIDGEAVPSRGFVAEIPQPPPAVEAPTGWDPVAVKQELEAMLSTVARTTSAVLRRLKPTTSRSDAKEYEAFASVAQPREVFVNRDLSLEIDSGPVEIALRAAEALAEYEAAEAAVTAARTLLAETTVLLREAMATIQAAQAAAEGDLTHVKDPGLLTTGPNEQLSQYERDLDAADGLARRLAAKLDEVHWMAALGPALDRHLRAVATVVTEYHRALTITVIAHLNVRMAKPLRAPLQAEHIMAKALAARGLTMPKLTWPTDPFTAPTIVD